jgi:peptide/nickel transport system permease protein
MLAGVAGGWVSEVLMRASDVLYAFPALLLAILLAAAFGASTWTAMVAIGVATVPAFARVTRAGTLQVLASDYVLAARAAGTGRLAIAGRHILPNVAPVIGVQASVAFGIAILAEAALSYLGLATPPPTPTWGRMLRDAQTYLFSDPVLALWPGLAIALAVLGFNLLGDGLRDVLDPRLRRAR